MKVIEVPTLNEDGSIKFTSQITAEEAQYLLQFAINYTSSVGLGAWKKHLMAHRVQREEDDDGDYEGTPALND